MHIYDIMLLIVALFFGIYGCLSGLEFGVAIARLVSNKKNANRNVANLFTPLWEITNVFLVFGFTGFTVFFNNALGPISQAILTTLSVAIIALLLRACLVLYIFYYKDTLGAHWTNLLFALCSYLVPLSFGAAGIYLLTGQLFWQSLLGWTFFAVLSLGLLSLGFGMAAYVVGQAHPRLRYLRFQCTFLTGLAGGIVLQTLTNKYQPRLINYAFITFIGVIDLMVVVSIAFVLTRHSRALVWLMSIAAVVSPPLLALANRPYLSFPNITLAVAYGAQAYGMATLVGTAIILPVILLGLGLFVVLFITQSNKS